MQACIDALPSEDELKTAMLSKLESGDYTQDGYHYQMDIEGAGIVDVSIMTTGTSSYNIGGITPTVYTTEVYIHSKAQPISFKPMTIEVPEDVKAKYDEKFNQEFLSDFTKAGNWERIGRRNAFKNTQNGAELTIKKGSYSYEGHFENIPGRGNKEVRMGGENLWERLANALAELTPDSFRHEDIGIAIDTLRADNTTQDSDTPEDTAVLDALDGTELTIDEIIDNTGLDRNVVAQSIVRLRNSESEYGAGEGGKIERFRADDNYIRFRKIANESIGETPTDVDAINQALQTIGITREDWDANTPELQRTMLQERYDAVLEENEFAPQFVFFKHRVIAFL